MVTHQAQRISGCRFSERCLRLWYRTGKLRALSVVTAWFLTFSGCKVGPDFEFPTPPALSPTYHQAEVKEALVKEQGSLAEHCDLQTDVWWNNFDDATLQRLLVEASSENLGVREAYFRIIESRARVATVRADWFPQANASAGYTYRDIGENASQFVAQNQNGGSFSYHSMGLDSSWEIDLFGRIARNVEAANAELLSQQESLHDVRIVLLADVATAYVQTRVLQQRLSIAKENLELQQQTLAIVTSRENAGLVGQLDQTEAESNVLTTRASIPPIEFELQATLYRLAVLLGRAPSGDFQLAENFAQLPIVSVETIYPGAPAALLARRPDIRKANFDVMAANARIGAAVADRLPQLTIRGDVSVEARDIAVLYSGGSLVHSVGPGFRWNILNWGRLKSVVDARRAAHDQALVRYQATVLKAVQEVESALVEYNRNQARASELENLVRVTRKSVEISRIRYDQNLINFDRVLDAQRGLATSEGNFATARGDVILSLIRAYKALGGGWQNPPDSLLVTESLIPSDISDDTCILPIDSPYRTPFSAPVESPESLTAPNSATIPDDHLPFPKSDASTQESSMTNLIRTPAVNRSQADLDPPGNALNVPPRGEDSLPVPLIPDWSLESLDFPVPPREILLLNANPDLPMIE